MHYNFNVQKINKIWNRKKRINLFGVMFHMFDSLSLTLRNESCICKDLGPMQNLVELNLKGPFGLRRKEEKWRRVEESWLKID